MVYWMLYFSGICLVFQEYYIRLVNWWERIWSPLTLNQRNGDKDEYEYDNWLSHSDFLLQKTTVESQAWQAANNIPVTLLTLTELWPIPDKSLFRSNIEWTIKNPFLLDLTEKTRTNWNNLININCWWKMLLVRDEILNNP